MSGLTTTLYRSLLRVARLYDSQPAFKAFLRRPIASSVPARVDHSKPGEVTAVICSRLTNAYFSGHRYYKPATSLESFVQFGFSHELSLGGSAGDSAATSEGAQQDVAIAFLSRLQNILAVAGGITRAYEDSFTLPALSELEATDLTLVDDDRLFLGCMLIDHPAMTSPGYGLHILTDTQGCASTVCVNKPLPTAVGEFFNIQGVFAENTLFHGGTDSKELFVMHPYAELSGSVAVAHGLFQGGSMEAAAKMVEDGEARPEDFKFIVGRQEYPLTEPGAPQLPPHFFAAEGKAAAVLALLPADRESMKEPEDLIMASVVSWANALRLLGGEYAEMATIPPAVMNTFNLEMAQELDTDLSAAELEGSTAMRMVDPDSIVDVPSEPSGEK